MKPLQFNLSFEAHPGRPVLIANEVVRLTAPNPGPMTFTGTNTYVVGQESLAVIDPGPDLPEHFAALTALIAGRPVSHILITHHHGDHAALAAKLAKHTGAAVTAGGSSQVISGGGWTLEPVATPGHTGDHQCFALAGTGILFTGDHVMGWSTTVILPPDGTMGDYMASLDTLLARADRLYLPGHGGQVSHPKSLVRALKAHRKMRERAIIQRLRQGDTTIADIVAAIYRSTDPSLMGAAAMSVLAHLQDLSARRLVTHADNAALDSVFYLA